MQPGGARIAPGPRKSSSWLAAVWQKLRQSPATLPVAALALMVAISYGPVFTADYIWDDKIFQEEAPSIRAFTGLPDIWFNPRTIKQEAHYWPLIYSSFWLEYQLWGFNPIASHIVNLLLHLGVCVLLWRLLLRLNVPGAWLAAAVFALHPVHVEAVAWVIARKDLMASIFFLLAAGAWLRYREEAGRGTYFSMLAFFVAGMLSKSIVVTFPAALLVWVWWKHGRIQGRDLAQTAPIFLVGFAITAGDLTFYHDRAVIGFDYAWLERFVIAAKALWFYAGKLLWPWPLVAIYPKWDVNPTDLLNWLPLLAGLALLTGLWLARHRIGRGPLAAALLFAIMLSPVLGLSINVFMEFAFAADRYQYFASASLIAFLVAAAVTACQRLPAGAFQGAKAFAFLALAGYGLLTFQYALAFRNDAVFWQHVVTENPAAHSAYYNLGLALVDQGQVLEGIAAYEEAMKWDPDSAGTFINLSFALLQLGRNEEAVHAAQRAVELDPKALLAHQNLASASHQLGRYEETLAALKEVAKLMKKPTAEHNYHMGHIATLLGRTDEAERYLLHSLKIDPNYKDARNQLLHTYIEAGRYDQARRIRPNLLQYLRQAAASQFTGGNYEEALKNYQHAVTVDPGDVQTLINMGATLVRLGRTEEALARYDQALAIDPGQLQGLEQLAYARLNAKHYEQAVELYQRLVTLAPDEVMAHINLGIALTHLKRTQEAEASFSRALQLDPERLSTLEQLATLRFNNRDYEQAAQLYRRLVSLAPDSAQAHSNLGSALAQLGRLQEAIDSFERALALDPRMEAARTNIKLARQLLEQTP